MKYVKAHLATIIAGLVVVGGASYVAAQQVSPAQQVALTQSSQPATSGGPAATPEPYGAKRGLVRGEGTFETRNGTFKDVKIDRGVVDHVDGSTVTITEADGTSVDIPTSDKTHVRRDGSKSTVADLKAGDHVFVLRVKDGSDFVTAGIRAYSPQRWQQMQDQRQQRRASRRGGAAS